jgi:hypothetical protein
MGDVYPFDNASHSTLLGLYNTAQARFGTADGEFASLGTNILRLKGSTNTYGGYVDQSLRQQETVNQILTEENSRLEDKKTNIDSAIQGQKRIINLNNSYSKRIAAYTKIIMFAVFAFTIMIIATLLKRRFPIISDSVVSIVYILMISASIIYAILGVVDISAREVTDFDKLAIPAPDATIEETKDEKMKRLNRILKGGKLSKIAGIEASFCAKGSKWSGDNCVADTACSGAECCNTQYTDYDTTRQKCVPKPEYKLTA